MCGNERMDGVGYVSEGRMAGRRAADRRAFELRKSRKELH